MPQVSVIIPSYNHARYLPEAISSVLAQTFTDWEAIIVDDGSTDNTAEVVAQFTDPRIRYIHQENRGLSGARNTGIRAAQGDYLAFLDADDEWEPTFLQRCLDALASNGALAGVYTLARFMDETGKVLPRFNSEAPSGGAFRERILQGGCFPVHAALVRADVVRAVGLFDTRLTSVEDWDLWLRISERYPMRGIAEPLVRYRVYPGSMSTNAARMHANRMAVLAKHFGPPEGEPATWSEEKRRAYGFGYRASAIGYLMQRQPDEAWDLLAKAFSVWPPLLQRLDTFYELACGDQPRGYRGQAELLDLEANGAEMLRRLDELFATAPDTLRAFRQPAYGNAYLALAMLSDQAGRWDLARRYLLRAMRANPRFAGSGAILRRLLKLCIGQCLVHYMKSVMSESSTQPSGEE